jgi:hypothetical protein
LVVGVKHFWRTGVKTVRNEGRLAIDALATPKLIIMTPKT